MNMNLNMLSNIWKVGKKIWMIYKNLEMNEQRPDFGILDKASLDKIQVLKQFIDFVASLKETSKKHRSNAPKVKYFYMTKDLCDIETEIDVG